MGRRPLGDEDKLDTFFSSVNLSMDRTSSQSPDVTVDMSKTFPEGQAASRGVPWCWPGKGSVQMAVESAGCKPASPGRKGPLMHTSRAPCPHCPQASCSDSAVGCLSLGHGAACDKYVVMVKLGCLVTLT